MKVCEHEMFQAYYCGLCKVLKKEYRKNMALNYDCTFIYLLGDSLQSEKLDVRPGKCILHPIKKKSVVVGSWAKYAADINVLMATAKAKDDLYDNGKTSSRLRLALYTRAYKKAAKSIPAVVSLMEGTTAKLHVLEAQKSANTDETADTYARLFGSVLQELDVVQSHILYDVGYSIGRWVYLIDAYDDIKKDIENGEYNVFVNKYGITGDVPASVKEEIAFNFNYTLSQAAQALERLELKKNRGILKNIICLGLRERTKKILSEGKTDESI